MPIKRPITENNEFLNRTLLDQGSVLSGNYWSELRVFLAVAKAKSFNRAAETLGISAATASRQVRRLQDVLKTDLFQPTPQGVQLTPSGLDLAVMLARLDQMLDDITKSLAQSPEDAAGTVRVSLTEGLAVAFLASAIGRFTESNPGIHVALKTPRNINDLRQNQSDMMIGFHPDDSPDIVCQRLGTLHFIPIASPRYFKAHGRPTIDTIDQHLFVQSEFYSDKNEFWRPWNSIVARGRVSHSCENSFTYGIMVKAGLGIGLLASYTTIEPSAQFVDLGVHIQAPIYAMALADTLNQPANRLVFGWLCEIFSDRNPWFRPTLEFEHAPSEFDDSFRLLFNLTD